MMHYLSTLLALLLTLCSQAQSIPPYSLPDRSQSAAVFYVRAGAIGDGSSAELPLGSTLEVERRSAPGDVILLLPSVTPLAGGLSLKPDQTLLGLPDGNGLPAITNADTLRHGGVGIVLADGVFVRNVRVEATVASGIYGRNISAQINGVEVVDANAGLRVPEIPYPYDIPLPHGGILLDQTEGAREVLVSASTVPNAAGFGIACIASGTAQARLIVRDVRILGGSPAAGWSSALAARVLDSMAHLRLEVTAAELGGRMTYVGRNIEIVAAGGAHADAQIIDSHLSAVGQDGLVAVAADSPSEVEVYVEDSVIEGAGQLNVEGTVLNTAPTDPATADRARITMKLQRCLVRAPGGVPLFDDHAGNVWLGSSAWVKDRGPSNGTYTFEARDCRFETTEPYHNILISKAPDSTAKFDPGTYDVTLRGNSVIGGGDGAPDLRIYAAGAKVDARGNCWGRPQGLAPSRIKVEAPAVASQVDASDPIPCEEPDAHLPESRWLGEGRVGEP